MSIPFEFTVIKKGSAGEDVEGDVIFTGNLVVPHTYSFQAIKVWDLKNKIWDLIPDTPEFSFKNLSMSLYLAKFGLNCTVSGGKDGNSWAKSYDDDDLTQELLNVTVYVYRGSGENQMSINDDTLRYLKHETRQRVVEVYGLKKPTASTETKISITVEPFNEEGRQINQERIKCFWPVFPTAFQELEYGEGFPIKTLRELQMMQLSASIRRKDSWYQKLKNPEINDKWKREAKDQGLTPNQVSYVFEELEYYASLRDDLTGIEPAVVDCVWHSDTLIEDSLRKELMEGVALLEDIPEFQRDWHPGSNMQVWDLVHPSLYPTCLGRSREVSEGQRFTRENAIKFCNGGQNVVQISPAIRKRLGGRELLKDPSFSIKFSWLPADFLVKNDGSVRIDSYINNLHPIHHAPMYSTLEKIFAKFVPMFENVLNDQLFKLDEKSQRITVNDWYDQHSPDFNDYEADDYEERYEQWHRNRPITLPDAPDNFTAPDPIPASKKISLRGTKLQVIVKLANIVLAPGSPEYTGGVWHVEGMKNENIVASGIYYYDVSNISESELAFRWSVREPNYGQNDDRGVAAVYGLNDRDSLNQPLGSVLTSEGRCLTFPNAFQHCVQPFRLLDSSKPGHRKILVFFLVDPGTEITSSATVPPQQFDWFLEELLKIPRFHSLFPEIRQHILGFMPWPLTLEKAKAIREELMKERKFFISNNNEHNFERPFSLCEH